MKRVYRDIISAILAIAGGVVMFAKLQSYNWWLIGSWRGALGVLAVLGLGILLTNITEVVRMDDGAAVGEFVLWAAAAIVVITSLAVTTTQAEFIWSGVAVGLAWLAQTGRHLWSSDDTTRHTYIPAH